MNYVAWPLYAGYFTGFSLILDITKLTKFLHISHIMRHFLTLKLSKLNPRQIAMSILVAMVIFISFPSLATFYVAYDPSAGWKFNNEMTKSGEGYIYKLDLSNVSGRTQLCFFDKETSEWSIPDGGFRYGGDSYDKSLTPGENATLVKNGYNNFIIPAGSQDIYKIYLVYDPSDSSKQYVKISKWSDDDENGDGEDEGGNGNNNNNDNPPSTSFYTSHSVNNNWTHNNAMTSHDDGSFTYELDCTNSTHDVFVTFFDGVTNNWNGEGVTRYGADTKDKQVTSAATYTLEPGTDNCFKITKSNLGKYTFKLWPDADTPATKYVTFTKDDTGNSGNTGDSGEENGDDDESFTIYYDNSTTKWSEVYIHYWSNPSSGTPLIMTKLKQENIWAYTFPSDPSKLDGILFCNDTNFSSKTNDYKTKLVNGNLYKGEASKDATTSGAYTGDKTPADTEEPDPNPNPNPDPQPSDKPDADIIVYFDNSSSNWNQPYCYAWNTSDGNNPISSGWPGSKMKLWKDNIWYWICPDNEYPNKVIFNPGGDDGKTGDLNFDNKATYISDGTKTEDGLGVPVAPPAPEPENNAGAVLEWENSNGVVKVVCEKATLFITPYDKNIVKVFTLPKDVNKEERRTISVVAVPNADFNVEETLFYLYVNVTDGLRVMVDKDTGLLSFLNNVEVTEDQPTLKEETYLDNVSHSVKLKGMGEAAYYGGGYNTDHESIMNVTSVMNNNQHWGYGKGSSTQRNFNIPFVVSTNGYGILFDDHYRNATIKTDAGGIKYTSGAQNPISYYYVGGGNLDEVMANYTMLTGRQPLPPYWALGYITSRYGYHSESEANDIINGIKNADIPLDGIVFDLYWEGIDESGMGNLEWYAPNFPDAGKMLKGWKDKGIHTTLITEPYFTSKNTKNWDYLIKTKPDYLADKDNSGMNWLKSDKVGLLDASNPEALDWMYTFYKARTEEGVDGWWLDLGEPEVHDGDAQHKGGTVDQIHNEFGLLWHSHIYNCLKRDFPNMRHFLMPRSGTSGMQHYAAFPWTGDISRSWGGLQAQIPSLINATMSGCSFIGSDVGGFAANGGFETNDKLYLRWIEFGALSPMLRTHSAVRPEPTNNDYNSIRNSVRDYINLRYRLLPYTYTLAYENAAFGYPMARPACAFDENMYTLGANGNTDSYLWGRDVYVAPVINQDATSRKIKFPEGNWLDLYDAIMAKKSQPAIYKDVVSNYSAPLERLPFFLRQGAFLPTFGQESFGNTADLKYDEITIYHYMNDSKINTGFMYVDDRTSADAIDTGNYSIVEFESKPYDYNPANEGMLMISISPDDKFSKFVSENVIYHIHVYDFNYARFDGVDVLEIDKNGEVQFKPNLIRRAPSVDDPGVLPQATQFSTLEDAQAHNGDAVYYDSDNNHAYIKLVKPSTSQVTIGMGDVSTGVGEVYSESNLHLEYCAGDLNYSVPAGYDSALIEIYTADGCLVYSVDTLTIDGVMHSVSVPASDGFYIARISAKNAAVTKTATAKFMAK